MFALVDYDPHGVAILRTYKNGSKRLEHEDNVTVPGIRWLGIHSSDLLIQKLVFEGPESEILGGPTQDLSRQESSISLHNRMLTLDRGGRTLTAL
jgi:meiotic recombination protein SPO11